MYASTILAFLIVCCVKIHSFAVMKNLENNKSFVSKEKDNIFLRQLCKKSQGLSWCLPVDYDKEIEPWMYQEEKNGSLPFYYHYDFRLYDIQEVNDFEHTLKLDLGFDIKWWEPRIDINLTSSQSSLNGTTPRTFFPIPLSNLELVWTPDVEIYGMNAYQSPKVFEKPMASLSINKEGVLRYSNRPIITMSCHMSFEKYPFDSHQCIFRVGSFAHHNEVVICNSSLDYPDDSNQRSLQYIVDLQDLPLQYQSWISPEHSWATCGFSIELKRTKTQMIIQVYLPSTSLVIISWFSFILNPNVVPGRMGMLLTIFLVLINIFIGVKNSSPISNGLNLVDTFLVVSIGQVFLVLMEYAFVLIRNGPHIESVISVWRNESQVKEDDKHSFSTTTSSKMIHGKCELPQSPEVNTKWNRIDMAALVLFPLVFTIFIIIYSQLVMN